MRTLPAAVALLFAAGPALMAQDEYGRGGIEIEVFSGAFAPSTPSLQNSEEKFNLNASALGGARLGYIFPANLFLQFEVSYAPVNMTQLRGMADLNQLFYGAALGYNIQASPTVQWFLAGGAGLTSFDFGDQTETEATYQFGTGLRVFLTPSLAVRVDIRDRLTPNGISDVRRTLNPRLTQAQTQNATNGVEFGVGLSFFFAPNRDRDADGIPDRDDACPDTPAGAPTDARGCPTDRDGDGVADYADRCPDTPAGAGVDAEGCPTDADGDGVPDGLDRCPATRSGAMVGEDGCARDSDRDGVPNGLDRCPNTPSGFPVGADGCTLDSDGDRVPDDRDRCPGTRSGVRVTEDGCELGPAERELLDTGRTLLRGVGFEGRSATLTPASRLALDALGGALVRHPDWRIEIQGHTDAVGRAAANLRLSQARAQAVLDYLKGNFPGLDANRFVARGYGEAQPIASNRTRAGRQQNLRIEIVILGRGG
ncbi:MAG: outer membrane beta-barrel domain-containing protein [Gemmatimonadota bacterium]